MRVGEAAKPRPSGILHRIAAAARASTTPTDYDSNPDSGAIVEYDKSDPGSDGKAGELYSMGWDNGDGIIELGTTSGHNYYGSLAGTGAKYVKA